MKIIKITFFIVNKHTYSHLITLKGKIEIELYLIQLSYSW